MPQGKGTYGSKKGRPSKKRKTYAGGGGRGLKKIAKGIAGGFGAVGNVVSGVGDVISNAPQTTADITKNVVSGGKKVAKAASQSFSSPAQSAMRASAGMSGPMGIGTSKIGQISSPGTTYGMQKYSDGGMVRAKPN
tara:strand:+ start:85 stop:492 length:408 start_codon:yes stop_codon:yes gene_type:complete